MRLCQALSAEPLTTKGGVLADHVTDLVFEVTFVADSTMPLEGDL